MLRLDSLMVMNNMASGREKAKSLILNGQVYLDGKCVLKPSILVNENSSIEIKGEVLKYVGRGGLKLEKAIDCFNINLNDKVCGDIGASTGGFSDCMLQNGAKKVYCVDVGHGQLAQKLIEDNRIINLEGVNVRSLTEEQITEKLDFISVDVSFISLTLILPVLINFLSFEGEMVCLIKPQFEAGKRNIGKKGIVKSPSAHIEVLEKIYSFVVSLGVCVSDIVFSPVKGGDGNIEYLIYIKNCDEESKCFNFKEFVKSVFNSIE